jgi:hypothetical protein
LIQRAQYLTERETYSAENVNYWGLVGNGLVSLTVLLADQAPQFIQVDGWLEGSVLKEMVCSHTNLAEVTWMAIIK